MTGIGLVYLGMNAQITGVVILAVFGTRSILDMVGEFAPRTTDTNHFFTAGKTKLGGKSLATGFAFALQNKNSVKSSEGK